MRLGHSLLEERQGQERVSDVNDESSDVKLRP